MKRMMALFALSACSPTVITVPINYSVVDDPSERHIRMIFENTNNRNICIDSDYWPNETGTINSLDERMGLHIGDDQLINNNNIDEYCPGGCTYRVSPGEEITATIPYSDFGVPEDLVNSQKILEFRSQGYLC